MKTLSMGLLLLAALVTTQSQNKSFKPESTQPQAFEDFLTGFLTESGHSQFGRVAGIAVARDGTVLVSDDSNGMIYRIAFMKGAQGRD